MKNYRNCWKTATTATASVAGGKLISAPEEPGLKMSEQAKIWCGTAGGDVNYNLGVLQRDQGPKK